MNMVATYQRTVFAFFFSFLCFCGVFSRAVSSKIRIRQGDFIRDREGEILVSDEFNFVMGFFDLDNSASRYVGIWYYHIPEPAVIWVANRDKPINGTGGAITVGRDGNLVVLDGQQNQVWSSNVSISNNKNSSEAVLRDDGNLVLSNGKVVWQSFENPTDTYVPGMKLQVRAFVEKSFAFKSWKSAADPSLGIYTMGVDPEGLPQMLVWQGEIRRWRSGYWDGRIFNGVDMTGSFLFGFTLNRDGEGNRYFMYNPLNSSKLRFQIGWDGYEREFNWNEGEKRWSLTQNWPQNDCEVYNKCGDFASCGLSNSSSPVCSCIQGFEPKQRDQWDKGNWSGGCRRRTLLKAERNASSGTEVSVGDDGFLELRWMKLPDFARAVDAGDCGSNCLQNATCTAYAQVIGIGCMVWYGELVDVQQFQPGGGRGSTLRIRLADSDLGNAQKHMKKRRDEILIIGITVATGTIIMAIGAYLAIRTHRSRKGTDSHSQRVIGAQKQVKLDELPLFDFEVVATATNSFFLGNTLGRGGFGPVYKGLLPDGQEIAVKRLSRTSGQGLEEFMNEVVVISKLQHRNLVRLLGCCIEGDEKMLIYEFMPNKSLDAFIFDPIRRKLLNWTIRFNIIEGIARGLLYLHRDSRLRIIHRDLKASNILLDSEMNPKISDFGLARIHKAEDEDEVNTERVVGTYGYMSPEYAMEGLFSEKSDVYSFGVLLLEIVSGRRNTSFRNDDQSLSLVGYAWNLWNEDKIRSLIDPELPTSGSQNHILRCIHIAFLCVQEVAKSRPKITTVVSMLNSEIFHLPPPGQVAFVQKQNSSRIEPSSQKNQGNSNNNVTLSEIQGR